MLKVLERIGQWRLNGLVVVLLRLLLGGVFLLSGFAKAIDPWGTMYKIQEYLAIMGMDSLHDFSGFFAVALASIEFLCGVFIISGMYKRMSCVLALMALLVFTPITFYIAVTGKVTECGCFGDVVELTNWQSFFKNLVLLLITCYLLIYNKRVVIYGVSMQWLVTMTSLGFIGYVEFVGFEYQPMIDFRPYKVGLPLPVSDADEGLSDGDNYEFLYENSKGEVHRFGINDSMPDDDDAEWTFIGREFKGSRSEQAKVAEGEVMPIAFLDDGENVAPQVITPQGEQLLLLFPDLSEVSIKYTYLINELTEFARRKGAEVVALTDATDKEKAEWYDLSMADYKLYDCDDTLLKTIARGNPAVVYVKHGIVQWKRTLESVVSDRLIAGGYNLTSVNSDFNPELWLKSAFVPCFIVFLIMFTTNTTWSIAKLTIKTLKKIKNKAVNLQGETGSAEDGAEEEETPADDPPEEKEKPAD
mgnify:FL=1